MAHYSVAPRAYALALLHAAKYPDAQVCGVLLGSVDKDGKVNVSSGLPLFHHWTSLTPMLEVALTQAEQFAAKRNEKIVGWYQANADSKDTTLHESAIRIANTIRQNTGNAIIFLVNNEKLSDIENIKDGSVIIAYTHSENQWRAVKQAFAKDSTVTLSYEETYAKVRGMLSSAAYNRLVDFDEHLEDITQDWLAYASQAA